MEYTTRLAESLQYFTTSGGFLTAKHGERVNTMTAAWGFVGFVWAKPCFVVMVRPQRYTTEIIRNAESFTVSIPFGGMKEELTLCGKKSGRDIDKSEVVRFVPAREVDSPVVDGCDMYYECRIIHRDAFDMDAMPAEIRNQYYSDDRHDLYYGWIVACYEGENK